MKNENVAKIRTIIKRHIDHSALAIYNDKGKTDRRIKAMWNGYDYSDKEYASMLTKIKADFKKEGVVYSSVSWISCMTWRGPYTALSVRCSL